MKHRSHLCWLTGHKPSKKPDGYDWKTKKYYHRCTKCGALLVKKNGKWKVK